MGEQKFFLPINDLLKEINKMFHFVQMSSS